MSIESVRTTGQLATVGQVTLAVTNNTGRSVRPAFTVEDGTDDDGLLAPVRGPPVLGPHQRARYTIVAPSYFAMPSIEQRLPGAGVPRAPGSVSRTGVYVASEWRVVLQPAAINQPVRVGPARSPCTPRSSTGSTSRSRAAHVPVYLGPDHLRPARACSPARPSSTTSLEGQTPVVALTNAQGVATFRISSPTVSDDPVYFEANLVNPDPLYPYGYSPILAVRFSK